ncbi:uncharacterized protein LOC123563992 [Mercenaria mercenaria]|uniref:uncharacterized protein LOC123563992 n=1 Tax=Mercenaria mercenaria TaxID=6596 RepID=UPI00234F08C2|nr:uncharacterized protein LOC123563992 [Mercenaria mercenaria]
MDKQNIDSYVSVPFFDGSFSSGKDDIFSCRTIESSDSDMSQSSNGSLDSQQDEDDLPQITYPKKIHLRPSEFLNTPLRAAKDEKLGTLVTNGDVSTAFSSHIRSQSHDKGSSRKFKTEPSKCTCTSDSNHLTSRQVKNSIVFPCVNKEQVHSQTECIDVPFESIPITTDHVSSSTSRWSPIVSKSVPNSWTPPRASGNQQTVTIESRHKIIYNNPVPGNIVGQSHFGNNKEYRGARPKYSAPTQNITVKLPLDPPQLQFMDTSSALSTPKAECTALNRVKNSSSSATISAAPDDNFNKKQTTLSASKPNSLLRPSVLINNSSVSSANSTATESVTVPSEVKPAVASISTQAYAPGTALQNIQYNKDTQNPDPIIIHQEPVDLELEQPDLGLIMIPDDHVQSQHVIQPEPQAVEIPHNPTIQVKNDVLNLFPDVDPAHLDTLCQQHTGHMAVNNICLLLLENIYPKNRDKSVSSEKKKNVPEMQSINYYKDYHSIVIPEIVIVKYQAQAFQILAQEFLWLSANDIKAVMKKVKHFYAPSYKALQTVWHQAVEIAQKKRSEHSSHVFRGLVFQANIPADQAGGTEYKISVRLLKNRRPVIKTHFAVIEELQKEIDFVKQKIKDTETEADHQVAVALNEQEYEDLGQCIECGCCFGEYPFEQMVQCYEGHLFCENCLRQYAKESVFGQGKADLICMTELCDSAFPKSQLMKALPLKIRAKYRWGQKKIKTG